MRKIFLTDIVAAVAITAMATTAMAAAAAVNPTLGAGVTKAAGYEAPPTQYIVANPTNVFDNHFMYGTKVVGELARGTRVEALAKVTGYEWVLIGRNGQGIGYVPISMLWPANLYVP